MVGDCGQPVENLCESLECILPGLLLKTADPSIPCAEFLTSVKQRSHIELLERVGSEVVR
jgi:hypothetical protein